MRNNGDIEILSSNPHLWHINDVMGMLKALTDRSGIRRIIAEDGGKASVRHHIRIIAYVMRAQRTTAAPGRAPSRRSA